MGLGVYLLSTVVSLVALLILGGKGAGFFFGDLLLFWFSGVDELVLGLPFDDSAFKPY